MKLYVGIFLFFFLFTSEVAVSQPSLPDHRIMVSEHTGVQRLTSIFPGSVRPVYLRSVAVPDTILAGKEGLFGVQANVETATLPIGATWDFGDGNTATGLTTRHAYFEPGEYDVEVTVFNPGGSKVARRRVVVIETPEP